MSVSAGPKAGERGKARQGKAGAFRCYSCLGLGCYNKLPQTMWLKQ